LTRPTVASLERRVAHLESIIDAQNVAIGRLVATIREGVQAAVETDRQFLARLVAVESIVAGRARVTFDVEARP
jgi:hypothetical protein